MGLNLQQTTAFKLDSILCRIRLRAMVALEEGQQLQHSYTYTLDGTAQRQAHLREGKYFVCSCERCLDASELQTHFSSLKCGQCTDGWLLPKQPTGISFHFHTLQ